MSVENSLLKVDGIVVCKLLVVDGDVFLQFRDRSALRSNKRGTRFVSVSLDSFAAKVTKFCERVVHRRNDLDTA